MSLSAAILAQVRDEVDAVLAGLSPGTDGDLTQMKRENTGLRNRVKTLEEKVAALEARLGPASVTSGAGTASASVKAKAAGAK
jgi:hypothetical protein